MGVISTRRTPAFCVSLACHLACFAALMLLMRHGARAPISTAAEPDRAMPRMVWLNAPGPGGGGGGGGNRMKEPPRPAERPGRDAMTVPAANRRRAISPSRPTLNRRRSRQLVIPVATLASAIDALPQTGAIGAPPSPTLSQGPGDGGGAGTGKGPATVPGLDRALGVGTGRRHRRRGPISPATA